MDPRSEACYGMGRSLRVLQNPDRTEFWEELVAMGSEKQSLHLPGLHLTHKAREKC